MANSPKYVYKILDSAPVDSLPTPYPPSALDENDGFLHLSNAIQVPKTADLFFAYASELWIMKLGYDKLSRHRVEWEGEGCVHVYGNFGADDVVSVEKCTRKHVDKWSFSLQAMSWLE